MEGGAGVGQSQTSPKETNVQTGPEHERRLWARPAPLPIPTDSAVLSRCAARALPRRVAAGVLTLLMLIPTTGCKNNDTRISLDVLQQLEEQRASEVTPVPVETHDLKLTEIVPHTYNPGDVLAITLTGLTDIYSATQLMQRVDRDGRITLPLVGKVQVTACDRRDVDAEIEGKYVPEYVKALSVYTELVEPEETTVVVLDASGAPRLVTLAGDKRNVLYAIASTQTTSVATAHSVRVRPVRAGGDEQRYDLTDANDLRLAMLAPPLESGDLVIIEEAAPSAVYVTGLVNSPGIVPVPRNGAVSLVKTVAVSGGLRDFLDPPEATLWRTLPDGEQVRVKLELADILDGSSPDLALLPGDILDVPHTPETRFREWVATNIRIGPFGVTAMYDPVADYRARILRDESNDFNPFRASLLGSVGTGIADLVIPTVPAP